MNPTEEAAAFLGNGQAIQRYHDAVSTLREIGFEGVLRRMGEPMNIPVEHPQYIQIAAAEQAEKRGYFQALELLFNFTDIMGEGRKANEAPDFGADEKLESMGIKF